MANALLSFYQAAVTKAPSLDYDFQRRALNLALKTKSEQLMIDLLARQDLDSRIDEAIGTQASAKILAAWFGRSGRTSEQIAARVKKEKRITVLESIASQAGFTAQIYDLCAAREASRVAYALAANKDATLEARRRGARLVGREFSEEDTSWSRKMQLDSMMAASPELADDFVAESKSLTVAAGVARSELLSPGGREKVLSVCLSSVVRAVKAISDSVNGRHVYVYSHLQSLQTITKIVNDLSASGEIPAQAMSDFVGEVQRLRDRLDDPKDKLGPKTFTGGDRTATTDRLDQLLVSAGAPSSSVYASLAPLRSAATATEIDEVLDRVMGTADYAFRRDIAMTTVLNKASTPKHVARVASMLQWNDGLRLGQARSDNPDVVVELIVSSYNLMHDEAMRKLAGTLTAQQLWQRVVQRAAQEPSLQGRLPELLSSNLADPTVVGSLPFSMFDSRIELPNWLVQSALQLINETLGDDAEAIEQFELLASSFSGTIEGLCLAATRQARLSRRPKRD